MCGQTSMANEPSENKLFASARLRTITRDPPTMQCSAARVGCTADASFRLELATSPAFITSMSEVIACDASPFQNAGFIPDDYGTVSLPLQLVVPVLAVCATCSGPADGTWGERNTAHVNGASSLAVCIDHKCYSPCVCHFCQQDGMCRVRRGVLQLVLHVPRMFHRRVRGSPQRQQFVRRQVNVVCCWGPFSESKA